MFTLQSWVISLITFTTTTTTPQQQLLLLLPASSPFVFYKFSCNVVFSISFAFLLSAMPCFVSRLVSPALKSKAHRSAHEEVRDSLCERRCCFRQVVRLRLRLYRLNIDAMNTWAGVRQVILCRWTGEPAVARSQDWQSCWTTDFVRYCQSLSCKLLSGKL